MTKRLLMSVAAAALIAGTGFATAQGPGGAGAGGAGAGAGGAGGGAPAARSAPAGGGAGGAAADRAAPTERSAPAGRDEATDTTNRSEQRQDQKAQSDDKMQRDNSRNATDSTRDNGKANPNAKAEGNNPDSKTGNRAASDDKGMNKAGGNERSATTGQAGAGAKLTTEQRTKVTTVIKQQNIKPVTNVNFSISVGTRVPRDVQFHPLPAEIVTVYPDWRGYDFILVNDQIIVINPRSYEIVAVIDA